jgi:hypothetical protein
VPSGPLGATECSYIFRVRENDPFTGSIIGVSKFDGFSPFVGGDDESDISIPIYCSTTSVKNTGDTVNLYLSFEGSTTTTLTSVGQNGFTGIQGFFMPIL